MASEATYYCFISYSRRDSDLARWLQGRLESYKYPASLVREDFRPVNSDRLRPVFLDTSDLPTSHGTFWDDICAKIDQSKYLLVVCSRASAKSEYVNKEIAHFLSESEERLKRIILAIADPGINLSSPDASDLPAEIFRRWNELSTRNHPIFLIKDGETRSTMRQRGLMQVISFMLGIEWTALYNRYLIAKRNMLMRLSIIGLSIFLAILASLGWALWKEHELTQFERQVFPYSLVVGYVGNFLSPLITSLEAQPNKPLIIIALPASYEELDHNGRVDKYRNFASLAGYTAKLKKVETKLPRGAETAIIEPTPPYYRDRRMEIYIDFASTVAAFKHVIDYKKTNPAYAHTTENEMLVQYADEFEKSVMRELGPTDEHPDQRSRVVFVRSPSAALEILARQ